MSAFGLLGSPGRGFGRLGGSGGGGSSPYVFTNTEAETWVAAFSSEPDNTRKALYDTYVGALKAASVWTKFDIIYLFAAHTSQAALINGKNPGTFDCTLVNAPTFTADRGFTGNGSSAYVSTGYVPSTNGSQYLVNSAHVAARNLAQVSATANTKLIGSLSGASARSVILVRNAATDGIRGTINSTTFSTDVANTVTPGHYVNRRSGANATAIFKDGVSVNTMTTGSVALTDRTLVFLADPHASNFSLLQVASGSAGANLTDQNITDYYNAEFAYMQAVGAA